MSAALAWRWRGAPQRGCVAVMVGTLAGWLLLHLPHLQVVWPWRMWPVLLGLGVALTPQRWRVHAGLLAAAAAPVVPLWVWLGNKGMALGLLWWGLMAASFALSGWGLSRVSGRGGRAVLAISAGAAALLLALTGSQSLATEATLLLAALLPWVRRPLGQSWSLALVLGGSLWLGLHLSYLGWAGLVPLSVLACLPLGRIERPWAGALAVGAAGLVVVGGMAPVVVDWARDPPF